MQTKLTLEQLRDLFYMEDRIGIVMNVTTTGSVYVPNPAVGLGIYFNDIDQAYGYIKGYYDAASNGGKLVENASS